jgi:hypothetical protein
LILANTDDDTEVGEEGRRTLEIIIEEEEGEDISGEVCYISSC